MAEATKKFAKHSHDSALSKEIKREDYKTERPACVSPPRIAYSSSSSKLKTRPAAGVGSGKISFSLKSTSSKDKSGKKEKRVYELPGQKHDPPDERDPLRIFYQSLYQENPKSEMAQIWMMEHGLLGLDGAKRALEIRQRNQLAQKLGPTSKISKNAFQKHVSKLPPEKSNSTTNGNNKALPNVKRRPWDDSDDDLILKPRKKLNPKC